MSGRYTDDMKTGLWKTDWYGFHEETSYKQGLKHGIYRVRYKDSYKELKLNAHLHRESWILLIFGCEPLTGA